MRLFGTYSSIRGLFAYASVVALSTIIGASPTVAAPKPSTTETPTVPVSCVESPALYYKRAANGHTLRSEITKVTCTNKFNQSATFTKSIEAALSDEVELTIPEYEFVEARAIKTTNVICEDAAGVMKEYPFSTVKSRKELAGPGIKFNDSRWPTEAPHIFTREVSVTQCTVPCMKSKLARYCNGKPSIISFNELGDKDFFEKITPNSWDNFEEDIDHYLTPYLRKLLD